MPLTSHVVVIAVDHQGLLQRGRRGKRVRVSIPRRRSPCLLPSAAGPPTDGGAARAVAGPPVTVVAVRVRHVGVAAFGRPSPPGFPLCRCLGSCRWSSVRLWLCFSLPLPFPLGLRLFPRRRGRLLFRQNSGARIGIGCDRRDTDARLRVQIAVRNVFSNTQKNKPRNHDKRTYVGLSRLFSLVLVSMVSMHPSDFGEPGQDTKGRRRTQSHESH